jgi:hypothetical protein
MKKGKKITVTISPDGTARVEAYCLATDSWADFKHFLEDAQRSKERGEERTSSRELRAALLCLFAHLEGTVGQILLERANEIPGAGTARTLCDKTIVISEAAKNRSSVPDLNFRLGKYLRDVIVHPGIQKTFGGEVVDETAVFDKLTIQTVDELGQRIDAWLNGVCSGFKVTRFTDTKAMVEEIAQVLGHAPQTQERCDEI